MSAQRETAPHTIYTALKIPTVTSYPSLKCLQWSADGQVCYLTKNAAYIFTPDHGINFDNSSTVTGSTPNNKGDNALGWFKTMIPTDKCTPFKWPEYSQAWGAVSLGSIDLGLHSVAISPSGLSANGGCIYATLTSNMDINLWTTTKNYLKGEWLKIFEVTPYLLELAAPTEDGQHTAVATLMAQIVSMEWTPQADFGMTPTPILDGSLFILGSRAGTLILLRHQNNGTPEHVASLSVGNKWIAQIAFPSWTAIRPGCCEGYLAYGTGNGAVGLVKITQTLIEAENACFVPKLTIKVDLEHAMRLVQEPDSAMITSMKWINLPHRSSILVWSNPGLIKLFSAASLGNGAPPSGAWWTGILALRIHSERTSTDCSPFHPVAGLAYLPKHDALVVTLIDGTSRVIRDFSINPSWALPDVDSSTAVENGGGGLNSRSLSLAARSIFEKVEKGGVDQRVMQTIDGMQEYDGNSCFMWVYESARPTDFSYQHDAKHSGTLVVAQLWDDTSDDILLSGLSRLLNATRFPPGFSPLYFLRPYFLHLRNPDYLRRLHAPLLEILRAPTTLEEPQDIHASITQWTGSLEPELRANFRASLTTYLFGWNELLQLRMKLSLADFAWKLAGNEQQQTECGVVAQILLSAISQRVLRVILRHLVAVVGCVTANDLPFVSRLIGQTLLPGAPPDLVAQGKTLSGLVQPLLPAEGNNVGAAGGSSDEVCPACGASVPLEDSMTAVCANGHTWTRCSMTTFVLSTPWVRTCVGCSRKAFLPTSVQEASLPPIARGWVVEELLEAVNRCLFCSNRFVSIL